MWLNNTYTTHMTIHVCTPLKTNDYNYSTVFMLLTICCIHYFHHSDVILKLYAQFTDI